MSKFQKNFHIELSIRNPKDDVKIDFTKEKEPIEKAVSDFNTKFNHRKQIEVLDIYPEKLNINLIAYFDMAYPGRELTLFSRDLYYNYNFQKYSSIGSTLFKVQILSEEQSNQIEEDITNVTDLEKEQKELMNDQEMIDSINFIVKMQEIGSLDNVNRKKESIKKIKEILSKII